LRELNEEAVDRNFEVPPPTELAAMVEQALGFAIRPPAPYPNYYGLDTASGILGERVLNALYCAHRIQQLTQGIAQPRVLEIGPGLGRLAHYAYLAGLTDYRLVDVPFTSLSHGHFLATALGGNRVVLDGEAESLSPNRIKIINSESFFYEALPTFDLVVSVDSLTELGQPLAERYFTHIAPRCRIFLSINHGVNEFRVTDVHRRTRVFSRSRRHPYWIRHGYVEELFWHDHTY
jgi:SAM-dependent methyltransferase